MTVECAGCGSTFQADRTRGMGPIFCFDVRMVTLRAYLGDKLAGAVTLQREQADAGGTLRERAGREKVGGQCLACLADRAVSAWNEGEIERGQSSSAEIHARIEARNAETLARTKT